MQCFGAPRPAKAAQASYCPDRRVASEYLNFVFGKADCLRIDREYQQLMAEKYFFAARELTFLGVGFCASGRNGPYVSDSGSEWGAGCPTGADGRRAQRPQRRRGPRLS